MRTMIGKSFNLSEAQSELEKAPRKAMIAHIRAGESLLENARRTLKHGINPEAHELVDSVIEMAAKLAEEKIELAMLESGLALIKALKADEARAEQTPPRSADKPN